MKKEKENLRHLWKHSGAKARVRGEIKFSSSERWRLSSIFHFAETSRKCYIELSRALFFFNLNIFYFEITRLTFLLNFCYQTCFKPHYFLFEYYFYSIFRGWHGPFLPWTFKDPQLLFWYGLLWKVGNSSPR